MNFRKFIKEKKKRDIDAGSVLIAQPFWQNEKYRRSVIMILCHDEMGSSGIILNKETTSFVSVANSHMIKDISLHYGGPFDRRVVSYIHNNPDVQEAIYMGNELYWGGDFETLKEFVFDEPFDWNKIKFFSGFVEWGVGQLADEIKENKWWTGELEADELFSTSSDELWSHKLSMNGIIYGILDELQDPSLN